MQYSDRDLVFSELGVLVAKGLECWGVLSAASPMDTLRTLCLPPAPASESKGPEAVILISEEKQERRPALIPYFFSSSALHGRLAPQGTRDGP